MHIDPSGLRSKEEATQIIEENSQNIKDAAEEFDIDPAILASVIYTEQNLNVNWIDDLTDVLFWVFDTSIGVSQVKVSTAKILEDSGYIEKTEALVINGREILSREEEIVMKLEDDRDNIRYAAAYLEYFQDRWENFYTGISGDVGVLATLYNQGEISPPHSNPKPNPFGKAAEENYDYVKSLLKEADE